MNKKDLSLVVVLILIIPVWLLFDAKVLKPRFTPEPAPAAVETPAPAPSVEPSAGEALAEGDAPAPAPAPAPASGIAAPTVEQPASETPAAELESVWLSNELLEVEVANLGAAVLRANLLTYPATLEDKELGEEGTFVQLDFSDADFPALSYNMAGLGPNSPLAIGQQGERTVSFSREVLPGLRFSRTYTLGEGYEIKVIDAWTNTSETAITLPAVDLYLGIMYPVYGINQKYGPFVGIDAMHLEGGVKHYVKSMRKQVGKTEGVYQETISSPMKWFGVKNKFFTQVLSLEQSGAEGMSSLTLRAEEGNKGEAQISFAQPSASMGALLLEPGQEMSRNFSYYVGPVSMDNLKALGDKQEDLIDFRLFRFLVPLGEAMMWGLNRLYGLVGNWGLAIILLTFVVRMLFWPLTQKGAENMKRMSELSPQMKEIKEKYKKDPQKQQQEMSKLYREHGVNPMAGCLPMLVQIPVFISLYGVLRVAVELRFAEFLWIKDLSEQEALFYLGGFPVNILPLTMGATMVLQQRLTPSNMDEQQKKIMMMMPVVFLFICYNMPAGLLLYWTTSNLISIYQTTHTRKRDAKKAASKEAGGEKLKPVKNPKASKTKSK